MTARVLVTAKAPVPGRAKTRLGAAVGAVVAADLAAAALLDTVTAATAAFPGRCHLALDGDLAAAARSAQIREALAGWHVFAQCDGTFGERLAHAHRTVAEHGPGAVVQVGMDTPQVTVAALHEAASAVGRGAGAGGADAALGPAEDGGWWVLALADGRRARALTDVEMSRSDTCAATRRALVAGGAAVTTVGRLRDVDTVADAAAVALAAPGTRFARAWRTHAGAEAS
jgi:glycosyltransferase A (GT-A) superfamily protein (DUF2064 family)